MLDAYWGPHTADRFTDNYNVHLGRFNSRFWCPGTEAVDAFTVNWENENNWWCPPIYLILRVLRHAKVCNSVGTLIVPFWMSTPFWPVVSLNDSHFVDIVTDVIYLEPQDDLTVARLPG